MPGNQRERKKVGEHVHTCLYMHNLSIFFPNTFGTSLEKHGLALYFRKCLSYYRIPKSYVHTKTYGALQNRNTTENQQSKSEIWPTESEFEGLTKKTEILTISGDQNRNGSKRL